MKNLSQKLSSKLWNKPDFKKEKIITIGGGDTQQLVEQRQQILYKKCNFLSWLIQIFFPRKNLNVQQTLFYLFKKIYHRNANFALLLLPFGLKLKES